MLGWQQKEGKKDEEEHEAGTDQEPGENRTGNFSQDRMYTSKAASVLPLFTVGDPTIQWSLRHGPKYVWWFFFIVYMLKQSNQSLLIIHFLVYVSSSELDVTGAQREWLSSFYLFISRHCTILCL